MTHWVATVIECPFYEGRWLVCRKNKWSMTTVVSDHGDPVSAERERRRLQAQFDIEASKPPFDPNHPQQMIIGFYSDDQV